MGKHSASLKTCHTWKGLLYYMPSSAHFLLFIKSLAFHPGCRITESRNHLFVLLIQLTDFVLWWIMLRGTFEGVGELSVVRSSYSRIFCRLFVHWISECIFSCTALPVFLLVPAMLSVLGKSLFHLASGPLNMPILLQGYSSSGFCMDGSLGP